MQFVSLEGVRRIELRSFNGGIKVSNATGPARLIVHRKGNVSVRSESINDILSVQAKRPFFAWNTAASIELILPAPRALEPGLSLALTTSNSPIEVSARVDRIKASTSGGRILCVTALGDRLRSGAAILGSGLGRDSQILATGDLKRGFVWPAFEERSFDAFHAYYRFVPKGTWVVEYTVRLNNPGRFELPPTRVEAMYAPEMFGELPNDAVTVKP